MEYELDSNDIAIEAWLRAPDTPLPKLLGTGRGLIDFTGRKVEHKDVESASEVQWARSLCFGDSDVLEARLRLLFEWPDDGQPLDIQLYYLETALDARLGIKGKTTIPPALSNALRGEAESGDFRVRTFRCPCGFSWNQRATVRPCQRKRCAYTVWADKTPNENLKLNAKQTFDKPYDGPSNAKPIRLIT